LSGPLVVVVVIGVLVGLWTVLSLISTVTEVEQVDDPPK
jgi:hypothetical protein